MAIRIFNNDSEGQPKKGNFSDDIVGRFRSGMVVNKRPVALSEWRITTDDPAVADAVAAAFGGEPEEWDATGDDRIEVLTNAASVDIILDSPKAVKSSMVIWGRGGKLHECDGEFLYDLETGELTNDPCEYASLPIKDHKEKAKMGRACEPSVQVYFRLTDQPDLGKFKFFSGSWSLAEEIGNVEAKLAKINGPALAKLILEQVSYTTKAGKAVSFTKPVIKVLGPAPAQDEEPC